VPKEQNHSTFGTALKEYWDKVNPLAAGNAIAGAVAHPIGAVKEYGNQTGELLGRAQESFKKGNYAEGVRHGLSFLLNGIPGLGAALDEAGNKAESGQYAQAAADTAALATQIIAGKYAPAAATRTAEGIAAIPAKAALALPKVSPAAADVAGLFSPRAAHALRILGRIQQAVGSPLAEAPAEAATAGTIEPGPRVVLAESEGVSVPRSAERQAIIDEANKPAHAAPEKVAESNTITNPQTAESGPQISAREAGNRTALAQDMADFLHSKGNGITVSDARRMGPDQWKMAYSAVRQGKKVRAPSPDTIQLTMEHLSDLWGKAEPEPAATSPGSSLSGRALEIARKLQAEMGQ
jgi:hypothetical protein